ncbi:cytochrome C oxidase subunit IV family protein [Lentisphaera marina]|uniref:cytochrome C oxidase subunit IV family protein n=1 Tax=Lentisphaera marina TaxID=1111041 RepID=UPI0023665DCA|nr:cytochrome C oxidase subunit IV family protein [Lentisphaera marina]MDD7985677.1 cytochrome C oxidase subunit IV family protein [Lentisphaera marina]
MSDHHGPESDHHPHVLPMTMYIAVGTALFVLTALTVWTAKFMPEMIFHFTKMQVTPTIAIIIALIIAFTKAALVCGFFMHLHYDKPLNRATFLSGIFFLSLFFLFTLADTLTRDDKVYLREGMPESFKTLTEIPHKPHMVKAMAGYCHHGVKTDDKVHPCHYCTTGHEDFKESDTTVEATPEAKAAE